MSRTAEKTDPELWERVKAEVTQGAKGGQPGQWSARKAQLAVQQYKRAGGGYRGAKTRDNHLLEWERQDWNTKSGRRSRETGERYLPRKAREDLSEAEYRRTSAKKRTDTAEGKQFSPQPPDIARKAARARRASDAPTRAELLDQARRAGVAGRSRMRKAELLRALRGEAR